MMQKNLMPQWFQELLDEFLLSCVAECALAKNTISAYNCDLCGFGQFINEFNIKDCNIETSIVQKYLITLHKNKVKRSTFLRKLSALNIFFAFLLSEKKILNNPMCMIKRPKKDKKLPKFLKESEIELLIDICARKKNDHKNIRIACIIEMLYSTGLRISELISIMMKDIVMRENSSEGSFIFIYGKGGKERIVPLQNRALNALEQYLAIRYKYCANVNDDGYLFISRSAMGHLTREQVGLSLKKLAIEAGIDPNRVSPHVIRHSFATSLCNKNIDLRVLQELLGHSDISTTEIYIDVMEQEIINFVQDHHSLNK